MCCLEPTDGDDKVVRWAIVVVCVEVVDEGAEEAVSVEFIMGGVEGLGME